ncbi:RING-box protein 2 [Parelaphostrongylus tenuis]|uniref:RING-box protein 2 n=1 Tax=Parelaphostrongylus tenuis TaxID=148309 RepID=A0AAD5LTL8_PARTN|nr:RING-box protein 2 [Parelaphostrongylus tenuis]
MSTEPSTTGADSPDVEMVSVPDARSPNAAVTTALQPTASRPFVLKGSDVYLGTHGSKTPKLAQFPCAAPLTGSEDGPPSIQKWNALATWAWDVDCDTCAICRVQLMEECLRCQAEASTADCVVVWGECNHAFHNCCMSQWVRQNNRCPLCQQDWVVQRVGR